MTDLMDRLRDHVAWILEQKKDWNADGWADPGLFTAHENAEGSIYLSQWHADESFWRSASNPGVALRKFAEVLVDQQDWLRQSMQREPGFFAWVFRAEAYTQDMPLDEDDETMAKRVAIANSRQIHRQPDRIEVASYCAASVDGSLMWLAARKDNGKVDKTSITRPGDIAYDAMRKTGVPSGLLRACRVTKWVTGG